MYTPGPWKFDTLDDDNFGISAGWTDIATVHNRDDRPEDRDNARLIAVAPRLLEALERCANKLEAQDIREGLEPSAELEAAQDAIAEAKEE